MLIETRETQRDKGPMKQLEDKEMRLRSDDFFHSPLVSWTLSSTSGNGYVMDRDDVIKSGADYTLDASANRADLNAYAYAKNLC